mmetsp:Transcript_15040/g.35620  ORF Transcript_15040/g.35620 Transcript_15040/m.35620 type:complete len:382 (-) Transcript_15040:44-1189(-)
MSIVGGSLIGTLTTRLPPQGSIVGGSLAAPGAPPYAVAPYPGGPAHLNGAGSVAVVPGSGAAAPTGYGSLALPPGGSLAVPQPRAPAPCANGVVDGASLDHGNAGSQVPCLTAGLPTPDAINNQKETYARSLEDELRQGVELLGATHKEKMDWLHAHANQQKHQHSLMLDQKVKQQEMVMSQHYNQQLMMLQQAAQQQRAELEQQAASLTLEWQQRQTQDEFMREQFGIQQRYAKVQQELAVEMEKVGGVQGGSALLPVPAPRAPPGAVQGGSLQVAPMVAAVRPVAPCDAPVVAAAASVAAPATMGRLQHLPPGGFVGGSGSYAPPAVVAAPGQLGASRSASYVPPTAPVAGVQAVVSRHASYGPPTLMAPNGISFVPPS